ncbi:MAG: YCF48-related protein [Pseudomonadota bacterium]
MKPISLMMRAAFCAALSFAGTAFAVDFVDVLDTPAMPSARAERALVNGLAHAGTRIVAAGQRGHILYSDDRGAHWTQAKVPVSSDLVALSFATERKGWAVGHDGIVLHSEDGGASWTRQLDGRAAAKLVIAQSSNAQLVEEARATLVHGPDKPFLDVWFENEQHGFVVGAFNQVFATDDGGKSWQSWSDKLDNPKGFHLYAVRPVGGDVFIVGEQGLVLKLDRAHGRFAALATPYKGSYFGVAGFDGAVLLFGLRGNAFRSSDGGATWLKVETGVQSGLTAAGTLADGTLVLVSQAGQVLTSADKGATFARLAQAKAGPTSAVIDANNGTLILGGARGLRVQPLK